LPYHSAKAKANSDRNQYRAKDDFRTCAIPPQNRRNINRESQPFLNRN